MPVEATVNVMDVGSETFRIIDVASRPDGKIVAMFVHQGLHAGTFTSNGGEVTLWEADLSLGVIFGDATLRELEPFRGHRVRLVQHRYVRSRR